MSQLLDAVKPIEYWLKKYEKDVHQICYSICKNSRYIDELEQRVRIKAFKAHQSRPYNPDESKFTTWIMMIARGQWQYMVKEFNYKMNKNEILFGSFVDVIDETFEETKHNYDHGDNQHEKFFITKKDCNENDTPYNTLTVGLNAATFIKNAVSHSGVTDKQQMVEVAKQRFCDAEEYSEIAENTGINISSVKRILVKLKQTLRSEAYKADSLALLLN